MPNTRESWTVGEVLGLLALFALCGSLGFEVRAPLYFDEVINSAKAERGLVFDYALRPLYYGANIVAWKVFGNDYESLQLVSVFGYLLTGLVLFRSGLEVAGRWPAWAMAIAYSTSQTVLVHGVRGMPHVLAGLLVTASLFCWLRSHREGSIQRARWWWGFFAAAFGCLAIACHVTVLSYLAALGAWAAVLVVFDGRCGSWKMALRSAEAGLLVGCAAAVSGALLVKGISAPLEYVGRILRGIRLVQGDNRYHFYQTDWYYYGSVILRDPVLLVALCVTVVTVSLALLWPRREACEGLLNALQTRRALGVLFLAPGSILGVSLLRWRFERVFVAFVPLLVLVSFLLTAVALRSLTRGSRSRAGMTAAAIGVVALGGVMSASRTLEALEAARSDPHTSYGRFTTVLSSVVRPERVGYIGDGDKIRARSFVEAADKEVVFLEPLDRFSEAPRRLEEAMHRKGLEFLITDFDPASRWRNDGYWEREFRLSEFDKIYEHRNRMQLWRLAALPASAEFTAAVGTIPTGELVGILGWDDEIGPQRAVWIGDLLTSNALRGYRLSLRKAAHVQFSYVPAKGIRHVFLIPPPEGMETNLPELRRLIAEAGGTQLSREDLLGVELWAVPVALK